MPGILAVNIDLDDIRFYRGIHALPERPERAEVFTAGLPRFLDLCESHGIRATLFVISCDMEIPAARAAIADAAARGHEIASHTRNHDYGVSLLEPAAIMGELARSRADLEDVCHAPVIGFRGPGYNLSPALLDGLVAAGYRYDTSILPSAPYWMARAAIILAMGAVGRKSTSIIGRGRDFFRSERPFTWKGDGDGLLEFPITVSGPLRMPVIGTTLAGFGPFARQMVAASAKKEFVNVEFHGIDFLDAVGDGLEPGLLVEPALKIPLEERLANFRRHVGILAKDRERLPLRELATAR